MSKRVLLLNTSFYPSIGGVENSLRGLSEALSGGNYEIDIVTGNISNVAFDNLAEKESIFGATVYRYEAKGFLRRIFTCYRLIRLLKKKGKYEAVISRSNLTTVCAKFAGMKNVSYIAPAVYKNQDSPDNKGRGGSYWIKYSVNCYLESLSLDLADRVFVLSENMVEQISKIRPKLKILKVFPGVDVSRFYPISHEEKSLLRISLGLSTEKKLLLCLGRAEKVKRFDMAIRSLNYLSSDYQLVIVGEGSMKDQLGELTNKLGLTDRVIFRPFTDLPELYYQASDFFLMTSMYEPLGQVILEALASGSVVVAPKSSDRVMTATSEIAKELNAPIQFSEDLDPLEIARVVDSCCVENCEPISLEKISWFKFFENITSA